MMVKRFLLTWCIYWVAVFLLPVSSVYPSVANAFFLQLSFVVLVVGTILMISALTRYRGMPFAGNFEIKHAKSLSRIALYLSALGLLCLLYDKFFMQGIDFSGGVSAAREEWRQLGEEREGKASSIFSMLGYLFGSFYYVTVVLVLTQVRQISKSERLLFLMLCFALVLVNSVITGGRSNILLLGSFVIAAMGAYRGLSIRVLFERMYQKQVIYVLAGAAFMYTGYIFYARAEAIDIGITQYVIDFFPYLGQEPDDWFLAYLDDGVFSEVVAAFVLIVSYISHSFATTAAIIDHAATADKAIIFIHLSNLLYKIDLLARPDGDWFLSGRFPSLPGALWLQFGVLGFVVSSIGIGLLSSLSRAWLTVRSNRLIPLGLYVAAESILILSPVLFAADFMSFPFVIIAFILSAIIVRARGVMGLYNFRKAQSFSVEYFD